MYDFIKHKRDAEEMLTNSTSLMNNTMKIALKIIIEMAENGIKLQTDLDKAYKIIDELQRNK